MANEEHLAILRQRVEVLNAWREKNSEIQLDLREANLRQADLRQADLRQADLRQADLRQADLRQANLRQADLRQADLHGANLQMADLSMVDLRKTNLRQADLRRTVLYGANLDGANLYGAILHEANLYGTNLYGAVLHGADFTQTRMGGTIFARVDLRKVIGLDTIKHSGPSEIAISTLYESGGDIPEIFLRGCGIPENMIEYARSLVVRPIDYYSCFISYADDDRALAERLYADLQAKGVRCWYAPHDLEIGEPILAGIDRGIRLYDKVLLILSVASVESGWIEQEVQMALARERNERRRVLFPIRIDDSVSAQTMGWPALVWSQRHVGDFCQWKDHDAYQAAFQRVLRDLTAKANARPD